jgi:hypothetical protein
MNKLILATLGILMVVGVSYQAKKSYDAHHGLNSATSTGENAQNGVNGINGTVGANGQVAGAPNGTAGANGGVDASGHALGMNGQGVQGSGVNGTVSVNGVGAHGSAAPGTAGTSVAKTEPEKPKDNCFAFEYRHKKEARDQDIENFLDFTNAFPVPANYNPKSLCVKVNQKAVNFQVAKFKDAPEVRVGSMVGPESVIRVSYCVGKVAPCHEKCDQPKNRFMDDLMNDATDDESFSDSWGKGEDEAHKKDLKAKTKELRAIASENDHLNQGSIQRDWEELQKTESFCK